MAKSWDRIKVTQHPVYGEVATFESDLISSYVHNGNLWEDHVCETLAEFYVPGTDYIDMGANLGLNTVLFNKKKQVTGMVHLFEPQYDVFMLMEFNTRSLTRRKLYNMAVSSGPGVFGYTQTSFNIGATLMKDVDKSTNHAIHVSTINLDALDFSSNRVSLIKMDVEGSEDRVLKGAQKFLEHHKPTLVIEVWNHAMHRVAPVLEELNYVQHRHLGNDDYVYVPRGGPFLA